jgi:hypothetical protein
MVISALREAAPDAQLTRDAGSGLKQEGVGDSAPASTLVAQPYRARRAVAINLWLIAALALWAFVDFLVYGTLDGLAFTTPFMIIFGSLAYRLARHEMSRDASLRHSGWMALLLVGLCGISLVASLAASPVDVACAVWSGGMVGGFGYAAWYQLRASQSTRIAVSVKETRP